MVFNERSYRVLFLNKSPKFSKALRQSLGDEKTYVLDEQSSVNAAKRKLSEVEYDFIVIHFPLQEENCFEFSMEYSRKGSSVVSVFVPSEYYSNNYEKLCVNGMYGISLPTSSHGIVQAFDWMATTRERLRVTKEKTVSLEKKMQDIKKVNRAKWLLIANENMDEEAAHRFIEKKAMDRRVSKADIAEEIIERYDD